MIRGMPAVMQLTRASSPCPPRAWSAMLASRRAWYSGTSGACCAIRQQALLGDSLVASKNLAAENEVRQK
jgi:hypothetical protein